MDDTSPIFLLQRNLTNTKQLSVIPASNFLECSEYCSSASNVRTNKIIKQDLSNKLINNKKTNGGGKNFLNKIFDDLITANASDCELWPEFDSKIQQNLQECVAIVYENGQCRIYGNATNGVDTANQTVIETTHLRLAQKSCVKVNFYF